ncbi:MAG: hypothetical protein OXU19_17720 [bacterium]|nr:hypothetical protein [bacterium]
MRSATWTTVVAGASGPEARLEHQPDFAFVERRGPSGPTIPTGKWRHVPHVTPDHADEA